MPNDNRQSGSSARRELIISVVATILVMVLILVLGLMGNKLNELEEQIQFSAPVGLDGAVRLPAEMIADGQAVYVPAYGHIYARGGQAARLESTLSVRNTDPEHPMRVDRVRYFDSDGRVLRELAEEPLLLGPMQTANYLVKEHESGGSGANFVVEWSGQESLNRPIIEAIMVGPDGLAFTSRGEAIKRHPGR